MAEPVLIKTWVEICIIDLAGNLWRRDVWCCLSWTVILSHIPFLLLPRSYCQTVSSVSASRSQLDKHYHKIFIIRENNLHLCCFRVIQVLRCCKMYCEIKLENTCASGSPAEDSPQDGDVVMAHLDWFDARVVVLYVWEQRWLKS